MSTYLTQNASTTIRRCLSDDLKLDSTSTTTHESGAIDCRPLFVSGRVWSRQHLGSLFHRTTRRGSSSSTLTAASESVTNTAGSTRRGRPIMASKPIHGANGECLGCTAPAALFLCARCQTELRAQLHDLAHGPKVNGHTTAGLLDACEDVVLRRTRLSTGGVIARRGRAAGTVCAG